MTMNQYMAARRRENQSTAAEQRAVKCAELEAGVVTLTDAIRSGVWPETGVVVTPEIAWYLGQTLHRAGSQMLDIRTEAQYQARVANAATNRPLPLRFQR